MWIPAHRSHYRRRHHLSPGLERKAFQVRASARVDKFSKSDIIVSPSILSANFAKLGDQVKVVEVAGCDWIHVDVMDGRFVPNITIGPLVVDALRPVTDLPLDVHLMIVEPEQRVPDFIKAGADIVSVHCEQTSTIHLHRTVNQDAWMNRYRAFAEAVVIMVCPVLLAIALKKVDLKSEEHGHAVPTTMLVVATVTLVAGICPFTVCCRFSKRFFNGSSDSPHTATMLLAPLSSTCLVALACWIIYLILHSWAFRVIGALIGLCSVIRTVTHFTTAVGGCEEYDCNKLESSLDFLAGITALLFLGLEGLALEAQINSTKAIIHDRLTKPMGTSFIVCVVGVGLMLLETMPSRKPIRNLTETIDIFMGFAVSLVMFFIMYAQMELRALLLLVAPFLILMIYVFYAAISKDDGQGNNNHRGAANGDEQSAVSSGADGDKPASLELTKVTFTGFLAVSIPSISRGSVNMSTECFLHLAAAAIVSGLVWRLLTHYKSQTTIAAIADIASFCTHLCVAVAVIPFTIMAGKALS